MAEDVVPFVFVSYTHDSPWHKQQVLDLATFLAAQRLHVCLDQWEPASRQDWYRWALANIPKADFVLAVVSAPFRDAADGRVSAEENRGLQAEAGLLRELLHTRRDEWTAKILPVVLPGHTPDEIPLFLQPRTADHYPVDAFTVEGAEDLLRAITGQAAHPRPPMGDAAPVLGPRARVERPTGAPHQEVVSHGSGHVFATVTGDQTITL
ncbi:toll/interleukin-1 receptor domain-containing protein [Actinosynnema sp. NPDC020468]|uniref:toll/interleukin-1 receptor domain-containing protein n=1 Tax=Actinosynnema sp. NPDC020468 TaxID=3154488 RepID=UPI003410335E